MRNIDFFGEPMISGVNSGQPHVHLFDEQLHRRAQRVLILVAMRLEPLLAVVLREAAQERHRAWAEIRLNVSLIDRGLGGRQRETETEEQPRAVPPRAFIVQRTSASM